MVRFLDATPTFRGKKDASAFAGSTGEVDRFFLLPRLRAGALRRRLFGRFEVDFESILRHARQDVKIG